MNALVKHEGVNAPAQFTDEQMNLIKTSFCKGLTDDEFKVFLYTCQRTGLDPFAKQIYAVKRFDGKAQREVMTIQTGIDGYRLIADRSGTYAPGSEPTFTYDPQGKIVSATSYVKKLTKDGTWHTVSSQAFFEEYVQTTKDGRAMGMWAKMGRTMLAKCAEALALRKAFPSQLSGIYTKEEMDQADVVDVTASTVANVKPLYISKEEAEELDKLIYECEPEKQEKIRNFLQAKCKGNLLQFPKECYENTKRIVLERRAEYRMKMVESQAEVSELNPNISESGE
jgi:phage recombination protein Bet